MLKPTKPKKFSVKIKKTQLIKEDDKIELNIKNSQTNFTVPGNPPKKTTIKKIKKPKLGNNVKIPDTTKIEREW